MKKFPFDNLKTIFVIFSLTKTQDIHNWALTCLQPNPGPIVNLVSPMDANVKDASVPGLHLSICTTKSLKHVFLTNVLLRMTWFNPGW